MIDKFDSSESLDYRVIVPDCAGEGGWGELEVKSKRTNRGTILGTYEDQKHY